MSVKKQIPRLCKLYSFYEEIPEEFLDETDVDSYFYHNIFDISQPQHRKVRVSRGSNEKSFAIKLFQFCDLKTATLYPRGRSEYLHKRTHFFGRQSAQFFSKLLITLASVYRFPCRSPKLRLDLRRQKTIALLITITISLNIQIDKFVYRSDLETTIRAYFPSKSLNYTVMNLFLQKLST